MDASDPPLQPIAEGQDYALASTADRSRFVLKHKSERMTAVLEGEDAERFRQDFETVKAQFPAWLDDQTLAQLWDQGGYRWLAISDEG
jgi:hypothetical protein